MTNTEVDPRGGRAPVPPTHPRHVVLRCGGSSLPTERNTAVAQARLSCSCRDGRCPHRTRRPSWAIEWAYYK